MSSDARTATAWVRLKERELWVGDKRVPISGRAFDVLVALVTAKGRMVSKEALLDAVWPGQAVSDGNLHVQVSMLRRALGADAIVVDRGRGYRLASFVAVSEAALVPDPGALERQDLIGRRDEVAEAIRQLAQGRCVVIWGPPGAGKSRLAQHVFEHWEGLASAAPDHVFVSLDLSAFETCEQALSAIAAALALPIPQGAVLDLDGIGEQVGAWRRLRGLILLDNCEHLAGVVEQILASWPHDEPTEGLRLIMTSRHCVRSCARLHLRLGGLRVHPVQGATAAPSPAVHLFVAWAQRFGAAIDLSSPPVHGAVTQICQALDGLPLALKLVAAKVGVLGIQGVLEALDAAPLSAWCLPSSAASPASEMHLLLEWSFQQLDIPQRQALLSLSAWGTSFTLEDAMCSLARNRWDAMNLIQELMCRSCLEPVRVRPTEPMRWRLFQCTRRHARNLLATSPDAAQVWARHAHACLAQALRLQQQWLEGHASEASLCQSAEYGVHDWCQAIEWASSRAADAREAAELALALFGTCTRWLVLRGLRSRLDAVRSVVGGLLTHPPASLVPAVLGAAWRASLRLRWESVDGLAPAEQAARACELMQEAEPAERFETWLLRALVAARVGQACDALSALEAAGSVWAGHAMPVRCQAQWLEMRHRLAGYYGLPLELSEEEVDEVLHDLLAVGDSDCRAAALLRIMRAERDLMAGRFRQAAQELESVVAMTQASDLWSWRYLTAPFDTLAVAYWRCGDQQRARESLRLACEAGLKVNAVVPVAAALAYVLAWADRHRPAALVLRAARLSAAELPHRADAVSLHLLDQTEQRLSAVVPATDLRRWQVQAEQLGRTGLLAILSGTDQRFVL